MPETYKPDYSPLTLPTWPLRLTYGERAKLAKCGLAAQCLELMERKKTNLSVAADVDTAEEMLALADKVRVGGKCGKKCGKERGKVQMHGAQDVDTR